MQVYLKKYFWTLGLVVTVVCAALAARGVNHIVEARYLLDDAQPQDPEPRAANGSRSGSAAADLDRSGDRLAARNLFCPHCEPPEPEIEEPEIETDPDRVPTTDLPLRLVATSVGHAPHVSFATILNTETNRDGAFWVNEEIPDAGDVVRITGRYVDFVNEDEERLERISLVDEDESERSRVASSQRREQAEERRQRRRQSSSDDDDIDSLMDDGIRETGDNSYEIARELVDQVLEDPSQVARGARIVPAVQDGQSEGFKLYAIRPNSIFAKVGLNNGDTINEINGFELTSPDRALEVYQRVRDASNIEVKVTRRGEPVTLDYSIR